jgi:hypothetical protein
VARGANVGELLFTAGAGAPADREVGQRFATPAAVTVRPGDCGGRLATGLPGLEPRPAGVGDMPRCGEPGTRDTVRRGDVADAIDSGGTEIGANGAALEPSAGKLADDRASGGGGPSS